MQKEKKKDKGTKSKTNDCGCCDPENFQEMSEEMSKCCPCQGDSSDFSAMKSAMMKNMMEMCMGSKATDSGKDN